MSIPETLGDYPICMEETVRVIEFGVYFKDGLRRLVVLRTEKIGGETAAMAVRRSMARWAAENDRDVNRLEGHINHGPIIQM